MKKFLFVCFFLFLTIGARADTLTLSWDAMPAGQTWTKVRIYEVPGYTLRAEVAGSATTASFEVDKLGHSYTARSFDGVRESADSNTVGFPAAPVSPGHLSFTIKAALTGIAAFILFLFLRKAK
jgi:hypothetical protein